MKFCYLDESGAVDQPILVMAGILVDATRMHETKASWADFLEYLSKAVGQKINEFHTRRFYSGVGVWKNLDGETRSKIITAIIEWIATRKHDITFSAIQIDRYTSLMQQKNPPHNIGIATPWCCAAFHCILGLQKNNQRQSKNKGHTVVIYDREVTEECGFSELVASPPEWSGSYYTRQAKHYPLNQIVDVPFFVNSEQVLLIQVADLLSYLLRSFGELKAGFAQERYSGEGKKLDNWVGQIKRRCIPSPMRYPIKGRCPATQYFWDIAPDALRF